jgi:hypothetical protein
MATSDTTSTLFVSLHPILDSLETATNEHRLALDLAHKATESVGWHLRKVDPTAWTAKIEAARGNPEELRQIRLDYDEEALYCMSTWLHCQITRRTAMISHNKIGNAILDALIFHDDERTKVGYHSDSLTSHICDLIGARLLLASALRLKERSEYSALVLAEHALQHMQPIQIAAFKSFVTVLPTNQCRRGWYTEDLVVSPTGLMNTGRPEGTDCRKVWAVEFVDCVNSKHPASAKLAELLAQTSAVFHDLKEAEAILKHEQNGSVNERQHANRLLEFLHSEDKRGAASGGNVDQQVGAQSKRRLEYETFRRLFGLRVKLCETHVESIVAALVEATAETAQLLAELEARKDETYDRFLTLQIMMNNCLAADVSLRQLIRRLGLQKNEGLIDLSKGAGALALKTAINELRVFYNFAIENRREELAAVASAIRSD